MKLRTYAGFMPLYTRSHTAKLGIIPIFISFLCPLVFLEPFSFNVEKHAITVRWKGVQSEGWEQSDWGHICSRTLAPMLRLVLTLSLALLCVWRSDFNAETRFSRLRHDSAYKLSCGLARSLANHRHTLKLVPLHLSLKLFQLWSIPWNIKGLCSAGIFSSSTAWEVTTSAKNRNCVLIHLPTLFNGWVMIAQSTLLSVPKLC